MSYDYNAIVQSINTNRTKAYTESSASQSYPSSSDISTRNQISNVDIESLNQAVEDYATLSTHCPLPPLLWLQYACDAGALMECLLFSSTENDESDNADMGAQNDLDEEELRSNRKQVSETRLGILGAGLEEFPGCKLLRRWYLDELLRDHQNSKNNNLNLLEEEKKVWKAFQEAIEWVCEGSYYHEKNEIDGNGSSDIRSIWKMAIGFLSQSDSFSDDHIKECFIHRSRIPMIGLNDELRDEISAIPEIADDADFLKRIENGRREACKRNQRMGPWEDEVCEAMEKEGIYNSHSKKQSQRGLWIYGGNIFLRANENETMQLPQHQLYLMGLGGPATANAFIKYVISSSSAENNPKHIQFDSSSEIEKDRETLLFIRIFERAVSECPTVEYLWITYIEHLLRLSQYQPTILAPPVLLDACHRSVRNCPYSISLFKLQMHCRTLNLFSEIDLDGLLEIAKVATEARFLPSPEAYLDVHMEVPRVIRRRLFKILSMYDNNTIPPFDVSDKDLLKSPSALFEKCPVMNSIDKMELVHDLIDDIREAYDAADLYVRKNHHNWNHGRAKLWKERAATEANVIYPICLKSPPDSSLQGEENNDSRRRRKKQSEEEIALEGKIEKEAIKCFEKLVRIHPKLVDAWREYIAFMLTLEMNSPIEDEHDKFECGKLVEKFRRVRGLYHRAIKVAGTAISDNSSSTGEGPLNNSSGMILCQDFITFEENFGSIVSTKSATNLIRQKLKKLGNVATPPSGTKDEPKTQLDTGKKRQLNEIESNSEHNFEEDVEIDVKKRKLDKKSAEKAIVLHSNDEDIQKRTNLKVDKGHIHYVQVGKMRYPAHPYTIHVSNLSPQTEDMDLVDVFKKCGGIVHAKILRIKSHNPKQRANSKGRGLVQFEEKESVEQALQLSENIGLHERLIKVERSHCTAVGIVPSGMHKINPRGGGKRSRINTIKKDRNLRDDRGEENEGNISDNITNVSPKNDKADEAKDVSKLTFYPRGLTNRNLKKKRLRILDTNEKK